MTRRLLITAAAVAGVLAGATPFDRAGAQDRGQRGRIPRPNVLQKAFEWSGELARGQQLVLRSLRGNIRVEASTGKSLDIIANKVWRRGAPESVKIEATRVNGGRDVLVCARWPGTTTCTDTEYSHSSSGDSGASDVRADFTIRLPAGTNAALMTTNGDITVNGASGDIRALTTGGSIRIETSETVPRAETTNGDIRIQMAKLPEQGVRYAAVNGSVHVTLPSDVNVNVDARTVNGTINTDFAIALQGPFSTKQVRGTIGKGGPRLMLESVNGSIRILKQ
jgi:DUF4097 and DUF4098 domain-containing protein YvlB